MDNETKIKYVGRTSIIFGLLLLATGIYLIIGSLSVNGGGIIGIIALPVIVISLFFLIGGIGFLLHKNWGRILLIIASVPTIAAVPIGTILSFLFFIVLMDDKVRRLLN